MASAVLSAGGGAHPRLTEDFDSRRAAQKRTAHTLLFSPRHHRADGEQSAAIHGCPQVILSDGPSSARRAPTPARGCFGGTSASRAKALLRKGTGLCPSLGVRTKRGCALRLTMQLACDATLL